MRKRILISAVRMPWRFEWLAQWTGLDFDTFEEGTAVTEPYNLSDDSGERRPIGHKFD